MRRKNLLKELGIQKQADTSCNALDIDTENVRQRVYAKLDFADTERKQTTMRSKKKILPLLIAATLTIGVTAVAATGKISMWTGSSASRAAYTSLPTVEQVTKDIGYRPVLIDTFENLSADGSRMRMVVPLIIPIWVRFQQETCSVFWKGT